MKQTFQNKVLHNGVLETTTSTEILRIPVITEEAKMFAQKHDDTFSSRPRKCISSSAVKQLTCVEKTEENIVTSTCIIKTERIIVRG